MDVNIEEIQADVESDQPSTRGSTDVPDRGRPEGVSELAHREEYSRRRRERLTERLRAD